MFSTLKLLLSTENDSLSTKLSTENVTYPQIHNQFCYGMKPAHLFDVINRVYKNRL